MSTTRRRQIMAAPYAVVGDAFRAETPQFWSPAPIVHGASATNSRVRSPSGRQAGRGGRGPDQSSVVRDKVVFVFNFADYL